MGFTHIFQMNGQGKSFRKITFGVLLFKNKKRRFFSPFLNVFNF